MSQEPNWDLYRSFLSVMQQGTLSGAARSLGLTQPTLGRHIEALEQYLGLPLFTRSPQGLIPTQAAQDLLPHVTAMALSADALIRQASGEASEDRGTIRLTASHVMGAEVLPPILTAFAEAHPKIEIELVLSNKTEDLLRREVDIAVRMVRPQQAALIARRLGSIQIGFFATRTYIEQAGMPATIWDFLSHRLIGYDRDPFASDAIESLGIKAERGMFRLRTDNDLAALAALRAGFGIGGCQWSLGALDPNLIPILPQIVLADLEVWVAMHEDQAASRRMRLLFDHLVTHLSDHVQVGQKARNLALQGSS